ncbi:hypothetical protein [Agromyces neolithicus]|uniref:Uncharacterized protein n=1 Tax=Agromyces neolithicus TaxID=269420 RepID=A0ABP4YKG6_9MICO
MGQNKRYGSDVTDLAILDVTLRPEPISLTHQEVGAPSAAELFRVDPAPEPVEVDAWVRFPETAVEVRARAIAWTTRAVLLEFELRDGRRRRTWVWAGAVRRVQPGEPRR